MRLRVSMTSAAAVGLDVQEHAEGGLHGDLACGIAWVVFKPPTDCFHTQRLYLNHKCILTCGHARPPCNRHFLAWKIMWRFVKFSPCTMHEDALKAFFSGRL